MNIPRQALGALSLAVHQLCLVVCEITPQRRDPTPTLPPHRDTAVETDRDRQAQRQTETDIRRDRKTDIHRNRDKSSYKEKKMRQIGTCIDRKKTEKST